MGPAKRIFVSYSRADGEELAREIRKTLEEAGLVLWQDRTDIEGGEAWWRQIEAALLAVEYLVLVATPAAMVSEYVEKEWRLARQEGVTVIPVTGREPPEFGALPAWMRRQQFVPFHDPDQRRRLIRQLEGPAARRRVPFMPDPPPNFVPRPELSEPLIDMLLAGRATGRPVGMSAVLKGAGGYGKTTLARAIAHDGRIVDEFTDGILWVTLGENPGDVTGRVLDLIETLTGRRESFQTAEAAGARLGQLLEGAYLLIVDDVWNAPDAAPFLRGGPGCVRLLTTRMADTLPPDCDKQPVDEMSPAESRALLSGELTVPPGCEALVERAARLTGRWPLLLKLANSYLRDSAEAGQPVADALGSLCEGLAEEGVTLLDEPGAADRSRAAARSLELSLGRLDASGRERFEELAIFPEDTPAPVSLIERLWAATGSLSRLKCDTLIKRLHRLSLLESLDLARGELELHDVIRAYLRRLRRERLAGWNVRLLDAVSPGAWPRLPRENGYLWRHLAWHLVEAGRRDELRALLLDFGWLLGKLEAAGIQALLEDFAPLAPERRSPLGLVEGALRLSAHVLAHDPRQLAGQLTGRLGGFEDAELLLLLEQALQEAPRPWLRPKRPSLTAPGGPLIRTLEGHEGGVNAVALTADGTRAVSASDDGTLKVWDPGSGQLLRTLEVSRGGVRALAVTPDGARAVSGSSDGTLRLWDLKSGELLRTLERQGDRVNAISFTPDCARLICVSDGRSLEVWDLDSETLVQTLRGHSGRARAVVVTPDGVHVVSASDDGTIKVWDLDSGRLLQTLEGHAGPVLRVAVRPDGARAVSASHDRTLRVWDLGSGRLLRTFRSHTAGVRAVAVTPDGTRAVSGSHDRTLNVWDLDSGQLLGTLVGHADWVLAVAVTPDGCHAISASQDRTLKVWDLGSLQLLQSAEGHSGPVLEAAVTPDGRRAVSAGSDATLKVWDLDCGRVVHTLHGHEARVLAVTVTPDGRRAVSASADATLGVWDLESGRSLHTLRGHAGTVYAVAVTPDGHRGVSGSEDNTLKVWDLESGRLLHTFEGHEGPVLTVVVTPDCAYALSGSVDATVRIWDLRSGEPIGILQGSRWQPPTGPSLKLIISGSEWQPLEGQHSGPVYTLAVTPDGWRAVSGSADQTLKVWALGYRGDFGQLLETLEGHGHAVRAVAVTPDGKLAVSASDDRTLKVWRLESGKLVHTLAGPTGWVRRVVVTSDGSHALSASRDGSVRLWDLASEACLVAFAGDGAMFSCALTPDERLTVCGDSLGQVHILELIESG